MDNSNVFVKEENQVNEEKPPPRVCPRCDSDNTKFCYYNNYSMSQPRYFCKNCRRYWTHGGTLRNIPVGGSSRKAKRPRIDQPSISLVSVEIQQVSHHHQPFVHVQENNEFLASAVGNHFGPMHEIHGDVITNAAPIRSFRPVEVLEFSEGSYRQDYYDVGSSDMIVGHVDNHNRWNQSFNNKASTSGGRGGTLGNEMNKNNNIIRNRCAFRSSYHLEKHGP